MATNHHATTLGMLEAVFSVVRAAAVVYSRGKHISAATNQHSTTEKLFEVAFPVVRSATVATQRCGKHMPLQ